CTPLKNLIHERKHSQINDSTTTEELFEMIYWQDAGTNPNTGKKGLTLKLFIEKYMEHFVRLANKVKGNTVADKVQSIAQPSEALTQAVKNFDKFYNIDWPMVHLNTARHYLIQKGEATEATGGSDWQKYLHPQFQRRKFFPFIYSPSELENWGEEC
ncbi:MAG: tryptophan 2,3-dioxygenase, partial [Flavobacteriaceae bacterium]|nr:tryptophan 2,3-dioxygenase [Flavobacteriaceae bacterium]